MFLYEKHKNWTWKPWREIKIFGYTSLSSPRTLEVGLGMVLGMSLRMGLGVKFEEHEFDFFQLELNKNQVAAPSIRKLISRNFST
jgi:hypothetical protein